MPYMYKWNESFASFVWFMQILFPLFVAFLPERPHYLNYIVSCDAITLRWKLSLMSTPWASLATAIELVWEQLLETVAVHCRWASTADGNKISLGNRISEASLPFSLWGSSSPWKDAYFSKHITNCISTRSKIVWGNEPEGKRGATVYVMNCFCSFTIELRQKLWRGERHCLNHKDSMCCHVCNI